MIASWHRRLPLFLRIFAVMLAVVIAAQALNFALVLMVRLPAPRVLRQLLAQKEQHPRVQVPFRRVPNRLVSFPQPCLL